MLLPEALEISQLAIDLGLDVELGLFAASHPALVSSDHELADLLAQRRRRRPPGGATAASSFETSASTSSAASPRASRR